MMMITDVNNKLVIFHIFYINNETRNGKMISFLFKGQSKNNDESFHDNVIFETNVLTIFFTFSRKY